MNRRQFLRNSVVVGTVAAVCPTALKIAERFILRNGSEVTLADSGNQLTLNHEGTITGRISGRTKIGTFQRGMGKTRAAENLMYQRARDDHEKRILHVTPGGQEIIQFGNESFAKLEQRVAASFNMHPEQLQLLRRNEFKHLRIGQLYGMKG